MKLARIRTADGAIQYAELHSDHCRLLAAPPFPDVRLTDVSVDRDTVRILAPVDPTQIVAIGKNYREHAAETGSDVPDAPIVFIKTPNTVVATGDPVILPAMAPHEVDYECELVIVIGKKTRNITEDDVPNHVLGYTCGNDVSARDCQLKQDQQWARGKCFDTFAPMGPCIETDLDPDNAAIRTLLNGEAMQDSNTRDLIFSTRFLVSYVSRCMTLHPGSVIMTGTPPGVGMARTPPRFLREGDTVTVEIDGIGTLTNPVVRESATR